jgi:UDP-N-acetylglucosamine--N-acetylmuramyl-(pentapeptide) pyrophosphoryl-undecaprenol N-acetylglucosamine transferase
VAGRATKFLARFAKYVAIAYPSARQYFPAEKTALMGNPVREEFLRGSADGASQKFSLASGKKTVFFLGGSLGSHALNHALLAILPKLLALGYQVIHHTGTANQAEVEAALKTLNLAEDPNYVARPFFSAEELADIFALSTVVVSRAGANSISELAAQKKAVILVPLPTAANDEQRQNAYEIAKIGGAVVMEEPNLGENLLSHKIHELVENPELRQQMGEALGQFYHPTAAEDIAKGIKRLIEHQSFQ